MNRMSETLSRPKLQAILAEAYRQLGAKKDGRWHQFPLLFSEWQHRAGEMEVLSIELGRSIQLVVPDEVSVRPEGMRVI
jgi:hypothetical protein